MSLRGYYMWNIAKHLILSKHAKQAWYCSRCEMKIYVRQPLCRKVRVFGRIERNSLLSQQPEPRPKTHCLRIGVISRTSVFKRIPTDSQLAETFFTLSTHKPILNWTSGRVRENRRWFFHNFYYLEYFNTRSAFTS